MIKTLMNVLHVSINKKHYNINLITNEKKIKKKPTFLRALFCAGNGIEFDS